jgi:methionyl-tRNA formyltransferase
MLPEIVWAMPRFGTFNVHAALLPQYRGAAPINWAIINGETETGVTTFFLDHDIDTGQIILQKRFPIPDDADVEYVYDGLMTLGAEIALETVDLVIAQDGEVKTISQEDFLKNNSQLSTLNSQLSLAPKLFKETCRINWNQSAKNIYNFVRGLSPIPVAWTTLVPEKSAASVDLKIYKTRKTGRFCEVSAGSLLVEKNCLFVATADEWLEILELQLAGKKRMPTRDFLNGFKRTGNEYLE